MGNFSLQYCSDWGSDTRRAELAPPNAVYGHRNARISQGSNVMTREGA